MNLEERAAYLQQCLENAMKNGASYGDICMYESTISEMLRISEWIRKQCDGHVRVYFEDGDDGVVKYFKFKNTTGIDFRFVAMKVNVKQAGQILDTFEIATANWKTGKYAKLYFDTELKDGTVLSVDADSIEYQVMKGEVHYGYKH